MNIEPTISMDIEAQAAGYEKFLAELEPAIKRSARQMRRQDRRAAIASFYALDIENAVEDHVYRYAYIQSVIKRHPIAGTRKMFLEAKREGTNKEVGEIYVAENANIHGSRAIRRKVSHDARKGTKPGLHGRGSVKLTDVDLVERHGRPALAVMTRERFDSAIAELNAAGRRLDLRVKSEFARTVDALADVFGRRVA